MWTAGSERRRGEGTCSLAAGSLLGSAVRLVRSSRMVCRWVTSPSMLISWSCKHTWTVNPAFKGPAGHENTRTDQHRLQHADERAVTSSFFNQGSAHGPLLRLLQDGVAHVDVLQRAVQLTADFVLPFRATHTRGRDVRRQDGTNGLKPLLRSRTWTGSDQRRVEPGATLSPWLPLISVTFLFLPSWTSKVQVMLSKLQVFSFLL